MNVNIELTPKKRTLVLISVLIQQFAFLLISFGNGAAMPTIVEGFGQSTYYALVGVVYSLSQAIVGPIAATIGDRIGRKWINAGSLLLMCVFLLCTYFADSFVLFLVSWFLCGVAVGGFMAGPFLIVMDIYEQKDWAKMSGNLVTALSAGMIVGPVAAGMMVDAGALRGIFLLPIPFFIIAAAIQFAVLPNKKREGPSSFDGLGVLWLTLALVPFVVILNFAGKMFPWLSPITLVLAVIMVASAVMLVRRETTIEQPAFAIGALKNKYVLLTAFICFLTASYSVLTAGFLVYFAQVVLQTSATSGSTLLLPQVLVSLVLPQFLGRWAGSDRRRYKLALVLLGILSAITLGGISVMKAGNSIIILYALMAIGGVAYTILNNLTTPFMTMNVPRTEMGAASGCKTFAVTLGTTVMGSMFGLMLGMFADFGKAISSVFMAGAICCLIVTPLVLIMVKNSSAEK